MSLDIVESEIEYPSSDGQPMAETEIHAAAIFDLLDVLRRFFSSKIDVYVAADLFWYWQEGSPNDRVAPDVMVIPGVGRASRRRTFQSWKENNAIPHTVFEFASAGTWEEDLDEKFTLYERLGVQEYFLFDPEGLYLRPELQGYRLINGIYRRMRASQGNLVSDLGFGVHADDWRLRIVDLTTGQVVLNNQEQADVNARVAEENARVAEENARVAEENARVAEQERLRANQLQAEVERLRAMLGQLNSSSESSS